MTIVGAEQRAAVEEGVSGADLRLHRSVDPSTDSIMTQCSKSVLNNSKNIRRIGAVP